MSSSIVKKFLNGGFDTDQPKRPAQPGQHGQQIRQAIPRPLKLPDPKELVKHVAVPPPEVVRKSFKIQIGGKNITPEEIEVPWFTKNINMIKNRSIIFYGPSGSGKTALIYDFMYRARYSFPKVMIFAPTNREKKDYEGIVPKQLIYEEFEISDIKNIYDHQRAAAAAFNTANQLEVLEKLYERVATQAHRQYIATICRQKQHAEHEVTRVFTDPAERKAKLEELETMHKNQLVAFYKNKVIKPNVVLLRQMQLSSDEVMAVKYLYFNPCVLIVFDDAMTEIQALIKKGRASNDNVILDFFFKGRHAYITHFYAFQDDNRLESEIKKNAFISIFTSPNVASAFFGRQATNFTKQDQARANAAIKTIFSDEDDARFRKMVYCRLDTKRPFQYTIADLHDEFQMCSRTIRNYCDSIARKDELMVDKNNIHMQRFSEF
jgi:hypothetical protein